MRGAPFEPVGDMTLEPLLRAPAVTLTMGRRTAAAAATRMASANSALGPQRHGSGCTRNAGQSNPPS